MRGRRVSNAERRPGPRLREAVYENASGRNSDDPGHVSLLAADILSLNLMRVSSAAPDIRTTCGRGAEGGRAGARRRCGSRRSGAQPRTTRIHIWLPAGKIEIVHHALMIRILRVLIW